VHVFVWCQGISGEPQLLSHIAVGEAVRGVFPRQEHLKEHALVARQGIEGCRLVRSGQTPIAHIAHVAHDGEILTELPPDFTQMKKRDEHTGVRHLSAQLVV